MQALQSFYKSFKKAGKAGRVAACGPNSSMAEDGDWAFSFLPGFCLQTLLGYVYVQQITLRCAVPAADIACLVINGAQPSIAGQIV